MVTRFLVLAQTAVDGYLTPDSGEDVVRVEAHSRLEFHALNLKRQLTWFDADNDPGFTHFYLDMSFERRGEDQSFNWFTINYGEGSVTDQDADLDAVGRALREHDVLQGILARVRLTVRTWIDGDLPDDPYAGPGMP
jgi:hypothetical protein